MFCRQQKAQTGFKCFGSGRQGQPHKKNLSREDADSQVREEGQSLDELTTHLDPSVPEGNT